MGRLRIAPIAFVVFLAACDFVERFARGVRYEVGPVVMTGTGVKSVRAIRFPAAGGWMVRISLNRHGVKQLKALNLLIGNKQPPENSFAIVVNDRVESAPMFDGVRAYPPEIDITGGVSERHAKA